MKRITAFILAVFMVFAVLPASVSASNSVLKELLEAKAKIMSEIEQKNNEISAIEGEIERETDMLAEYESQYEKITEAIEKIKELIDILKTELSDTQRKLDDRERELDGRYDTLGQRLRYMHMNDAASPLSVILGADSFSDALVIGHYMADMAEQDARLIDEVISIQKELETLRGEINVNLSNQEVLLDEQEDLESQVYQLMVKTGEAISYAEAAKGYAEEERAALIAERQKADEEITAAMSFTSGKDFVGGTFLWPVPGFSHISSPYGWRTLYGQDNFHRGIDIAGGGIYGAPAIASNSGVVNRVVYGTTGYGHYVIIDHGGGYATLYGHLSAIYVSEGQEVSQSEPIGAVGSTGNSTGPHLHFEIRVNGDAFDPMTLGASA